MYIQCRRPMDNCYFFPLSCDYVQKLRLNQVVIVNINSAPYSPRRCRIRLMETRRVSYIHCRHWDGLVNCPGFTPPPLSPLPSTLTPTWRLLSLEWMRSTSMRSRWRFCFIRSNLKLLDGDKYGRSFSLNCSVIVIDSPTVSFERRC